MWTSKGLWGGWAPHMQGPSPPLPRSLHSLFMATARTRTQRLPLGLTLWL